MNAQLPLKIYGVQINVTDMKKALAFYADVLGFEIGKSTPDSNRVWLRPKTGSDILFLNKVSYLLPINDKEARPSLTLQVNHLDSAIMTLKSKGINIDKSAKRKEGVGYAIYLEDPFGTRISLMHETVVQNPHFSEPAIYNYGFYIPDMTIARKFFTNQLGFVSLSEKYLPLDLPLGNADKSFAFMLHTREGVEAIHYNSPDNEHIVILFRCDDLDKTMTAFKDKKINIDGPMFYFYDPFGYISKVIEPKAF
jgi:predicted enzyme related to lactoylglutathione lyase